MLRLITVNTAWVSPLSSENFAERIARFNKETFSREDLIKQEEISSALHKVRSNLKFFVDLELIYKPNGEYHINQEPPVLAFFKCKRENKYKEAKQHLAEWLLRLPFYKVMFEEFFSIRKIRSINEFSEFLKDMDREAKKPHVYKKIAEFHAKFLEKLDLVGYDARAGTIKYNEKTVKKDETQKQVKEESNGDMGLFHNDKKIPLKKSIFIKIINNSNISEEDRGKILEELL